MLDGPQKDKPADVDKKNLTLMERKEDSSETSSSSAASGNIQVALGAQPQSQAAAPVEQVPDAPTPLNELADDLFGKDGEGLALASDEDDDGVVPGAQ